MKTEWDEEEHRWMLVPECQDDCDELREPDEEDEEDEMPEHDLGGEGAHESGLTCVHAKIGLCEFCRADYDEDSNGWIEFGAHPAGIEAWHRLSVEMDAKKIAHPTFDTDEEIPF